MFISFVYVFWVTVCPSSGEITVSMRHFVFVTLCGWLSGLQGGIHSILQTRQSSTQSDKYEVSHRYSYFSWWWAHSHPKHVEKRNKHTKKNCAPSWLYLQDYTGLFKMIVGVLTTSHTQYTWDRTICFFFYLIEQHSQFLLHTLQVLFENF